MCHNVMGISFIAEIISMKGSKNPFFLSRIIFNSSSVGGISGVFEVDHNTEPMEHTEPTKKEPNTQYGIPDSPADVFVSPVINF